jgi:hypothetical protein
VVVRGSVAGPGSRIRPSRPGGSAGATETAYG